MSQYPYGYGGRYPPHNYQQYYQQQQSQQVNPQQQHVSQAGNGSQQHPQMWSGQPQQHQQAVQQQQQHPSQQQQQQAHYMSSSSPQKVGYAGGGAMSGVLPPGISVVRDSFSVPAAPCAKPASSGLVVRSLPSVVSSAGPPPPLLSKGLRTQRMEEEHAQTQAHVKQYKPLVKHFANSNELGFDLSRVKTEPGLLLKGPPSLTPRPQKDPTHPGVVSTSRGSSLQSNPPQGSPTLMQQQQEMLGGSNRSSDVDSGMEEDSSSGGAKEQSNKEDNADSTLILETEEGGLKEEEGPKEEGLPDTASELRSLDFFSNLKNPVVGKDTLCIFCASNCLEKNPKLLNCLHTVCSACLGERLKDSLKNMKGSQDVLLDLEGAPLQRESFVYCPLCKIKTLDNEVVQNLTIITADQAMDCEDSEGQICNSCDEGNAPTQWCKDCSEYLCEDCVKAHQRVKMTKDHTLKLVLSSTKKQLSSSSSSVPSLETYKVCPSHSHEYLDFYCDNCDKVTCRECQLSPEHQGHAYKSSLDASADIKFKFRQMASDVKLKRNALDENRSLLKTKLIEVEIKEKSLLNQLKDIQTYLITKIESRFKDLITEATKAILDKRKALTGRKDTLDRLFSQADHSLAFVDHMVNLTWTEVNGGHLGILAAKRSVERQMRRLKKTDISTGLTDQSSNFKLDAYFQQYSGSSMHEGLDSCLKQMLADVKLLNAPPKVVPVEAPPRVAPTARPPPSTSQLEQKVVLKRPPPESPPVRTLQQQQQLRFPTSKHSPTPKRGGASTPTRGGRGGVSSPAGKVGMGRGAASSLGRGRGVASNVSGTRGGRGGSLRGAATVSNRGSRGRGGGVARGGVTNSMRAKTLTPSAATNVLKGNPGVSIVSRGSPATRGSPMAVRRPSQQSITPVQQKQQPDSRPPVLKQMTQITVTSSNAPRSSPQGQQGQQQWALKKANWQQQGDQRSVSSRQPLPTDPQQQQNNYFIAAYGQQTTTPTQAAQTQPQASSSQYRQAIPGGSSLSITPQSSSSNPSWHSPQVESTPPNSSTTASSSQVNPALKDTSFKITLPSISKISAASGVVSSSKKNNLPMVKKEILDLNEEPPVMREEEENSASKKANEENSLQALCQRTTLEIQRLSSSPSPLQQQVPEHATEVPVAAEKVESPKESTPEEEEREEQGSAPVADAASAEPAASLDEEETGGNPSPPPPEDEDNKLVKMERGVIEGTDAEDWCAICHDGGDVQYCCDRCPKVYHLYCYIPPLTDEPPDDWVCLMCATVDEVYQYSNTVEKGKLGERDLMICRRLLFELFNQYPQSSSFKDRADLNFPQYLKVVKEPIALDLIKERLDVNNPEQYSTIEEFLADVRRMFKNCYSFHEKDSQWFQDAKELEEYLDKKLEEWMPQLAYDQTVISSSKSKKKRNLEPTPGPSSVKKRKHESVSSMGEEENESLLDSEPSSSSQKKKKKSKKSKSSKHKKSGGEASDGNAEDDGEESESFSEGEKLDYLDNLEAKLVKRTPSEDEGKGTRGGGGGGGRTRRKSAIKLKISK